MMIGLGIEIVAVQKFERFTTASEWIDLEHWFTSRELDYCRGKRRAAEHLAARFAAKGATLKALGLSSQDSELLKAVEVVRAMSGQPEIELSCPLDSRADTLGIQRLLVSMSHSGGFAVSMVVSERVVSNERKTHETL